MGAGTDTTSGVAPGPTHGAAPVLGVVLDGPALGAQPESTARSFFDAGADWIQLRDRTAESAALFALARALVAARDASAAAAGRALRVVVNRRADIAWAAGADGVHLGFDALAPATVRRLRASGEDPLVGRSTHSADEVAEIAAAGDVDYVHLAPIWDPVSKPASRPPLGPAGLAAACAAGLPVIAQGGIDVDRAVRAIEAGAAGVALTGAVTRAKAPDRVLGAIRAALDRSAASRWP